MNKENCRAHHPVKRLLISALVLGLTILAPGPTSLCALASSFVTECASPDTQTQCDQMDMGAPSGPVLAAQTASCCSMTQAPLPQARHELSSPAPEPASASLAPLSAETVILKNQTLVEVPKELSPPPLQPVLCTFLI